MQIEPAQIVAGRSLVGWSQATFAKMSGLAVGSIRAVEGDSEKVPSGVTVAIAVATLAAVGVRFHRLGVEKRPAVSLNPNHPIVLTKPSLPALESIPKDRVLASITKAQVDPLALAQALMDLKAASITKNMSEVIAAISYARDADAEHDDAMVEDALRGST